MFVILYWQGAGWYAPCSVYDNTYYHRVCGGNCGKCRIEPFCSGPSDKARGLGLGTPSWLDQPWPNPIRVSEDVTEVQYEYLE